MYIVSNDENKAVQSQSPKHSHTNKSPIDYDGVQLTNA